MFQNPKRSRAERTLFQFTRLEEHFFGTLQKMLCTLQERAPEYAARVIAQRRRPNSPYLELLASLGGESQTVVLQVHGLRPVRYHIQTPNTPLGRKLRRYFSLALGEENLNLRASQQTGEQLSLLYHVHYPEEVLKRLGA